MGNTYWVVVGCCMLCLLIAAFLINKRSKKKDKAQQQEDRGINLTDSVALAVEFFFQAKFGRLDKEQQSLIFIDPGQNARRCNFIMPDLIEHENSGDSRIVYFGTRENYDKMFRVVMVRRPGEYWRVVGFHYPCDSEKHFYAVFEPHYYWFGWRDKSGYLSPLVNPSY